jgi:aspartate aminotransferase
VQPSPTSATGIAADVAILSTGDVRLPVHPDLSVGGPRFADQAYPPTTGAASLRRAICAYHAAPTIDPAQILVAPGARLAILAVLRAALQGRTEVLLPVPYWASYPAIIETAGGTAVPVPAPMRDGRMDLTALTEAVSSSTGVVVVNTPRNPDGAVADPADLARLVEVTEVHRAILLLDEVYRGVPLGEVPPSLLATVGGLPDHCVVVDGLTKSHALAGLRLGWAVAGARTLAGATAQLSHLVGGTSATVQEVATAALADTDAIRERLRSGLAAHLDLAVERLSGIDGVVVTRPYGGIFLFPDLRGWLAGSSAEIDGDLTRWLRDEHRVAVVDGAAFGAPGHVRLSFAVAGDDLHDGLDRLRTALMKGV